MRLDQLVCKIVSFKERQFEVEDQVADFIISLLKEENISFINEVYPVMLPRVQKAWLKCDGCEIECRGSSFVSGRIDKSSSLVDSLNDSEEPLAKSLINYNPMAKDFSRPEFYFVPALNIKYSDCKKVTNSKNIEGMVEVLPVEYIAKDILVGNILNPKYLLFAHYDSIGPGVIDNAIGVSILLKAVLSEKQLIKDCLFIFTGNEELSYDQPIYWGHGFREFENNHFDLLAKAKKILVVDGPANRQTTVQNDSFMIEQSFPITRLNQLKEKIEIISSDINNLKPIWHADDDLYERISLSDLEGGYQVVLKSIAE